MFERAAAEEQVMSLTIRAARSDDAMAMLQVRREAILSKARSSYPQPTVDAWVAEATPDRAERYMQEITDPEFIVLVAESGDGVIAFGTAIPAKGELSTIYVKPNPIGRVGHALLSQLEKHAFRTAEALICVAALSAVRFYEANGYIDQGSMDYVDGSGAGVPCIQMKKIRPTPIPIDVRTIGVDDWRLWRELRLEALREAPCAFGSTLAEWQGKGDTEIRWRARLATVQFNVVGYLNGEAPGMASGTAADQDGASELISMWVAPFARGRGVGDSLVAEVVEWARGQQAAQITLAVVESNAHARILYRRHGFVDVGAIDCTDGGASERHMVRYLQECNRRAC